MARKNKRKSMSARRSGSVSVVASAGRTNEFNPDYTHVKQDLRRIGSLAGFFFVALIVLSFFLK